VPGASWLLFAPLLWANALENVPMPSIATKMPVRQRTEPIRTRRLKKADCEVDFFFMDGVKFSLCGEPETVAEMLGEMLGRCQLLFFVGAPIRSMKQMAQHRLSFPEPLRCACSTD